MDCWSRSYLNIRVAPVPGTNTRRRIAPQCYGLFEMKQSRPGHHGGQCLHGAIVPVPQYERVVPIFRQHTAQFGQYVSRELSTALLHGLGERREGRFDVVYSFQSVFGDIGGVELIDLGEGTDETIEFRPLYLVDRVEFVQPFGP